MTWVNSDTMADHASLRLSMSVVRTPIRIAGARRRCAGLPGMPESGPRAAAVVFRHELPGTHEGARQDRTTEASAEAPRRTAGRISEDAQRAFARLVRRDRRLRLDRPH